MFNKCSDTENRSLLNILCSILASQGGYRLQSYRTGVVSRRNPSVATYRLGTLGMCFPLECECSHWYNWDVTGLEKCSVDNSTYSRTRSKCPFTSTSKMHTKGALLYSISDPWKPSSAHCFTSQLDIHPGLLSLVLASQRSSPSNLL